MKAHTSTLWVIREFPIFSSFYVTLFWKQSVKRKHLYCSIGEEEILSEPTFCTQQVVKLYLKKLVLIMEASQVAQMVKNPPASAGDAEDMGSVPGSARCPGGGHGNSLPDSCLENPMDTGAWRATVRGVAKSRMRLSD